MVYEENETIIILEAVKTEYVGVWGGRYSIWLLDFHVGAVKVNNIEAIASFPWLKALNICFSVKAVFMRVFISG